VIYQSYGFDSESDTQSRELRLNGTIGRFLYQVGGFYFKEDLTNELGFFVSPIGLPGGSFLTYFGRDISSDSKSAFGQLEFSMTDTLTAVGGLRYTKNKRSATYIQGNPFVAFDPTGTFPIGFPNFALLGTGPARKDLHAINAQIQQLGSEENQTTWLVGLNYKPNSDTLIYGKVSTGFKGGGFDAIGTYKPETNTAYEAGWKQSFGERARTRSTARSTTTTRTCKSRCCSTPARAARPSMRARPRSTAPKPLPTSSSPTRTRCAPASAIAARYDELLAQFNVYTVPGTGPDINGVGDLDPNTPGIQQPNFEGNTPAFSPEWMQRWSTTMCSISAMSAT
jgi:iron complex outermembrane receptor protein